MAGKAPVTRNRFIALDGATKSVNRDLEAKARALAGIKGYTTNISNPTPEFAISSCAVLWPIEKSFRMSHTTCAPDRSTTTNARRSTRT